MKDEKEKKDKAQKKPKASKDDAEQLRRQLEQLEDEKQQIFEQLQRISADYANFQKRSAKQLADNLTYEKESIIRSFLPILDNFEHTLENTEEGENADAFTKGVRIIYDQMLGVLKYHNVEQVKAIGETFDPSVHEAMIQRCQEDAEDNIVLEEFQKGYTINGRVIRPSKVVVNKLSVQTNDEDKQQKPDAKSDKAEKTDTE